MTPAPETTITIRMDADTSSVTNLLPGLQTDAKLSIADEPTFARVARTALDAKDRRKELRELPMFYGTPNDPGSIVLSNDTHAKLMDQFNAVDKVLKKIVDDCETAMRRFRLDQKAVADRARQVSDEAIRKENAEHQRAADEEATSKQRQAELLRKIGMEAEAAVVEAVPAPVVMPMPAVQVVVPAAPRVAGQSEAWPWTAEVVNGMDIIVDVAAGEIKRRIQSLILEHKPSNVEEMWAVVERVLGYPIPLTYNVRGKDENIIEFNEPLIRALAKQRQADIGIRGVRSFEEPQFRRSRR